jgi:uncharacterized membrane protein (Fun14 family)
VDNENLQGFLLGNVGAPFLIGLAVGYFAKKALKIALFMGGLAIVVMFVSEYYGFTTISDEGLKGTTTAVVNSMQSFAGFLTERLSHITSRGLSAVAGFAAGLKFG